MILDGFLLFTGNGATAPSSGAGTNTDSVTTTATTSSYIVDIGLNGLPTSANGGGARDIGIGDNPALELLVQVTTAFVGATSLQISLQGAPDNGSGAPGAFTTMWTGPAVVEASLVAGVQLANVTMPLVVPGQVLPRYLQLLYTIVGGPFESGALEAGVVLDRFDNIKGATGALSGYPAGITVAN